MFDHELTKFNDIKEDMFQIAFACVSSLPDQRLTMVEVLKMIQDVKHLSDASARVNCL